jgi:hypothetical protein
MLQRTLPGEDGALTPEGRSEIDPTPRAAIAASRLASALAALLP